MAGSFRSADFDCEVERKIWIEGRSSSAQNNWSVAVRDVGLGGDDGSGIDASAKGAAGGGERKVRELAWDRLADEYFEQVYFKFAPSNGTSNGLHQYDALLEDYSRTGIDANVAALHGFEKRVEAMDAQGLDETRAADRELVLANIRGTLLTLAVVRPWEKNPDSYSSGISNSVYVIMIRKFASADERLRSVVAREKKMPEVFAAARANLKNPPRIYTEIALEQLPDIISFFQNDVPAAFAGASEPGVKAAFAKSNGAVIADLQNYAAWLKSDVLPRSNGDFRIGAETFSKKLLYDENGGYALWTSCWKSAGWICTRTRRSSSEWLRSWNPINPRAKCWRS